MNFSWRLGENRKDSQNGERGLTGEVFLQGSKHNRVTFAQGYMAPPSRESRSIILQRHSEQVTWPVDYSALYHLVMKERHDVDKIKEKEFRWVGRRRKLLFKKTFMTNEI